MVLYARCAASALGRHSKWYAATFVIVADNISIIRSSNSLSNANAGGIEGNNAPMACAPRSLRIALCGAWLKRTIARRGCDSLL